MNLKEKQLKLLQITKLRILVDKELQKELITEKDLIDVMYAKSNFGFKRKDRKYSYKQRVLMDIYNSPFLLCDQENLSLLVKKQLPKFLKRRYEMEINELKYLLDNGYLSKSEYKKEEERLKYYYYESSNDGINILETGYAVDVEKQYIIIK